MKRARCENGPGCGELCRCCSGAWDARQLPSACAAREGRVWQHMRAKEAGGAVKRTVPLVEVGVQRLFRHHVRARKTRAHLQEALLVLLLAARHRTGRVWCVSQRERSAWVGGTLIGCAGRATVACRQQEGNVARSTRLSSGGGGLAHRGAALSPTAPARDRLRGRMRTKEATMSEDEISDTRADVPVELEEGPGDVTPEEQWAA